MLENTHHASKLAYVSVILDDRDENVSFKIDEPLLTAGWFDYGKGKKASSNWNWWYALYYIWVPGREQAVERPDDGSIYRKSYDPDDEESKFRQVSTAYDFFRFVR